MVLTEYMTGRKELLLVGLATNFTLIATTMHLQPIPTDFPVFMITPGYLAGRETRLNTVA